MTVAKKPKTLRPHIACEITLDRVIAGRASAGLSRLEMFTSRQLPPGSIVPGLSGPNVLNGEALRTAVSGALGAVSGSSRDVTVIVPDAAIRVLLLDFEGWKGKEKLNVKRAMEDEDPKLLAVESRSIKQETSTQRKVVD